MILRILAQLFGKEIKKIGYGTIAAKEIQKLIPSTRKDKIYLTNPDLSITDNSYKLAKKEQIQDFVNKDNISWYKYKLENFDCDDFAISLFGRLRESFPGFAIGYAQSKEHAFNIFIDDKRELWIIEPQTDQIFKSTKEKYKIDMCLI